VADSRRSREECPTCTVNSAAGQAHCPAASSNTAKTRAGTRTAISAASARRAAHVGLDHLASRPGPGVADADPQHKVVAGRQVRVRAAQRLIVPAGVAEAMAEREHRGSPRSVVTAVADEQPLGVVEAVTVRLGMKHRAVRLGHRQGDR